MRSSEPKIEIELVLSNQTENLLRHEADIALRMYRPTQSDVITRKTGDLAMGIYASHSYLEQRGTPKTTSDFRNHDIIGFDRSDQVIQGFEQAGLTVERQFFAFRCDNQIACWRMVIAGFGIGFSPRLIGDAEPRVSQIPVAESLPVLPIWLTAHSELKTSRRVRRVFDFLAEELQNLKD